MTTEPTDEFVKATLDLSQECLDDCIAFLDQGRLRASVASAYYSIHHTAIALLSDRGIRPPKSHRGLVNLFSTEIVSHGILDKAFIQMLSDALRYRMLSTYSPQTTITRDRAEGVVDNAKRFVAKVRSILNY